MGSFRGKNIPTSEKSEREKETYKVESLTFNVKNGREKAKEDS